MEVQVADEVLRKTRKCDDHFSCLKSGRCKCEVEFVAGDRALCLKGSQATGCRYQVSVGENTICRCPTHYALYVAQHGHTSANGVVHGQAQSHLRRILVP